MKCSRSDRFEILRVCTNDMATGRTDLAVALRKRVTVTKLENKCRSNFHVVVLAAVGWQLSEYHTRNECLFSRSFVICSPLFGWSLRSPQGFPRSATTLHVRRAGFWRGSPGARRPSDLLLEHRGEITNRRRARWSAASPYDVVYVPRSRSLCLRMIYDGVHPASGQTDILPASVFRLARFPAGNLAGVLFGLGGQCEFLFYPL